MKGMQQNQKFVPKNKRRGQALPPNEFQEKTSKLAQKGREGGTRTGTVLGPYLHSTGMLTDKSGLQKPREDGTQSLKGNDGINKVLKKKKTKK